MKGRIPDHIVETVLSRVNIVEVVSEFIPLKRAGRNFRALCPFHQEKTPSFMVSTDKQIYHCFGCGAGGNVFNFLMQFERIEFPEAVEILAKKAGVVIPESLSYDTKESSGINAQLQKACETAASFYENNLSVPCGTQAREYLLKRGIPQEAIKAFRMGFAVEKWDALINHLRSKGINLSLMEKAGLVVPKEGGGYYDRFRNRIIFPILDVKARVIGFGARVLDKTLPKYINSPETPLYIKGKNLYGLWLSKDVIRDLDAAVVVEGYLDFISAFQQGVRNVVASSGTALTAEQARLIKRYTHNVVMVYDGDASGQIATIRALDIFIEEDMQVRVVSLPEGQDPDLFIRKNGIECFRALILKAQPLFDYKMSVLKSRYDAKEIEGKEKICSEMLSTIQKFRRPVVKSEYFKKLAQELKVKEEALLQEAKLFHTGGKERGLAASPAVVAQKSIHSVEQFLIKLMLEEDAIIAELKDKLEPDDFLDERTAKIVTLMFDCIAQGKGIEPSKLLTHLGDAEATRLLCESTFLPDINIENREKILADCVQRLKAKKLTFKRQCLQEEIKAAQEKGDEERLHKLIAEFDTLIKTRRGTG
ncbi:MAG: DNA primase [Candidatus Omnitrophota bacterium]|jgi:DNA primase|nr:MAG: DNA primase [Candidatus Omnitrophota bacterium]